VACAAHEYGIFDKVVLTRRFQACEASLTTLSPVLWAFESLVWSEGRSGPGSGHGVIFGDNDTERYSNACEEAVALIHGKQDRLIPYTESVRIHDILGGHAQLCCSNAGHVETAFSPGYARKLDDFFRAGAVTLRIRRVAIANRISLLSLGHWNNPAALRLHGDVGGRMERPGVWIGRSLLEGTCSRPGSGRA